MGYANCGKFNNYCGKQVLVSRKRRLANTSETTRQSPSTRQTKRLAERAREWSSRPDEPASALLNDLFARPAGDFDRGATFDYAATSVEAVFAFHQIRDSSGIACVCKQGSTPLQEVTFSSLADSARGRRPLPEMQEKNIDLRE